MIRYFLAKGDRAGGATITEGLKSVTCSNPPPCVEIATLYMKTYCSVCKREGFIAPKGPRRPGTAPNGEQWALSGDINVCGCEPAPVFHAERAMKMTFTTEELARLIDPAERTNAVSAAPSPSANDARHVHRFAVRDSVSGEPMAHCDFVADVAGVRRSGRTDGEGCAKIVTDGEQSVRIRVVFSSPKRGLKPREQA